MDLKQLDVVVAIAEHGTFSAAARSLHTVQSNVSAHLARLERELGVSLVDRSAGTLTEEGELVVARARSVQREIAAVASDVAALHDVIVGEVRLGVIGTVGRWLVPRLLEVVHDRHPRVTVVVVDATTTSLLPQLIDGSLDLAVINLPVSDSAVTADLLFDEARIVVAPEGHPLSRHDRITVTDLAGHEFVLEPKGTAFRDELDAAAAGSGISLRTCAEVDGMGLVASLAFGGFAPAIIPATAVTGATSATWRRVAIDGVDGRAVGLARRRAERASAPSRTVAALIDEVVVDSAGRHDGITLGDRLADRW